MQFLKTLLCVEKALTVNNGFRNRQENKGFNKKFLISRNSDFISIFIVWYEDSGTFK